MSFYCLFHYHQSFNVGTSRRRPLCCRCITEVRCWFVHRVNYYWCVHKFRAALIIGFVRHENYVACLMTLVSERCSWPEGDLILSYNPLKLLHKFRHCRRNLVLRFPLVFGFRAAKPDNLLAKRLSKFSILAVATDETMRSKYFRQF